MKCLNCKKEFTPKRADAKYCSAACKLKYNRIKSTDTDNNDTDNDTDNTNPIDTDKITPIGTPEHLKTYTDHCHFCNHKFGQSSDGKQLMGWVCADCISKATKETA